MYEENAKMAVPSMVGQLNSNQQNRNFQNTSGASPKDAPMSIVHTERLFAGMSELQGLIARLTMAADRLAGPVPQAETVSNDRPPPANLADRLDFAVSVHGQFLARLRQEVERVERFV